MKRVAIVLAVLVVGVTGTLLITGFVESDSPHPIMILNCSDSVGQRGRGGEKVIGGVEGLVLPESGDPASLRSLRSADGNRYFVYKAFLAVSAGSAPYATVSVVRPRNAKLYYGSPGVVGTLATSAQGRGSISGSKPQVRLPVCGPNYTGFVGGIIVVKPTSVTFAVSSAHGKTERVTVSIGDG
ncbi:MAG TPA: hypothetical protein VMU68_01640 [Acidimicrobiales bacterium]|nr:hypothetical protein [Acidimicrobiales bacterium]